MKTVILISVAVFTIATAQVALAATYTVDNTTDNGALTACTAAANDCSLRGAIANANASFVDDIINFDATIFASAQTITLSSNTSLDIFNSSTAGTLVINGTGATNLTIAAGDGVTNPNRVFLINGGGNLTLNGVTITRGRPSDNLGDGGGIKLPSGGTLIINNSVITGNTANSPSGGTGGGIAHFGGGILTINNSTVSNNKAANNNSIGGGIYTAAVDLTITNSTISGNTAVTGPGGLQANGGNIRLTNSTISGNSTTMTSANGYAAGADISGQALLTNCTIAFNTNAGITDSTGGLRNGGGIMHLRNTIVAQNTSPNVNKDILNTDVLVSVGNNLVGNNTGAAASFPVGTPNASNDYVGNALSPVNPKLSLLGNYGGATLTHALHTGSLALDHGNNCVTNSTCPPDAPFITPLVNTDQRGTIRPANGTVDIGAYEKQANDFVRTPAPFDLDGDGKTDISIFRPAPAEWWYLKSSNGSNAAAQFGASTDIITPADFTGDGKTDIAVWRPISGFWFVLRSEDNSFFSFPFGANGDIPVPADYDGDGCADAAVFRPATGTWFISRSSGGTTITNFGINGDKPVAADYDGDGKADIAIYRPSNGQWWLNRSTGGVIALTFGVSTDKPVQGDYTGDGKADIAFFRPSTGTWFILRSEDSSFFSFPFGTSGDIPAPGDYDGDGKFDSAVFRPSSSTWFVQRTTAGTAIVVFGIATDRPVPNAFVP